MRGCLKYRHKWRHTDRERSGHIHCTSQNSMVGHWLMLLLVQLQSDQQTLLYQGVAVAEEPQFHCLQQLQLAPATGSTTSRRLVPGHLDDLYLNSD